MAEEPSTSQNRQIILFDGVCAVCDALVLWILDRDPTGLFVFATLQGETAARLRAAHADIPDGLHTIVLIDQRGTDERIEMRSRAVFQILGQLATPWRLLAWLRWAPRFITDLGYLAFARIRYRVFGQRDSCRIPDPEHSARFLP